MAGILYFAYGSNMLTERLRSRCPAARAIGNAQLLGWNLNVHKRSKDGSGKATVVRDASSSVWGVLFEIDERELEQLDRHEGYGAGYDRRFLEVAIEPPGDIREAITYLADPTFIDPSLRPYDWYLALIVAGARDHELPPAYIDRLLAIPAIADPETDRPSRLEALALLQEASEQ